MQESPALKPGMDAAKITLHSTGKNERIFPGFYDAGLFRKGTMDVYPEPVEGLVRGVFITATKDDQDLRMIKGVMR